MRYAANFNDCSIFEKGLSWKDVIWLNAAKEVNRELDSKTALDIKYCLGQTAAMLQGFLGAKTDFKFASELAENPGFDDDEEPDTTFLTMKTLEKMHG